MRHPDERDNYLDAHRRNTVLPISHEGHEQCAPWLNGLSALGRVDTLTDTRLSGVYAVEDAARGRDDYEICPNRRSRPARKGEFASDGGAAA
jgi:hypothetical protein